MTVPFVVCALITAISSIVSFGFSVGAALKTAGEARTMALYACARSAALVLVGAASFLTGSTPWLLAIASCMIIVQAGDATIGALIRDRVKTFGPAGTAVVNLAAMIWLLRSTLASPGLTMN
jgi:hypothetical protein